MKTANNRNKLNLIKKTFNFLFNKKQKQMEQEKLPILHTMYSQDHVLRVRMREQNLTHGQTVKADLSPVRVEENFGKAFIYFCPLQKIDVKQKINDGDGGQLPDEAILVDLKMNKNFKPGLYSLRNVQLFSNGTIQVIATDETEFIPHDSGVGF